MGQSLRPSPLPPPPARIASRSVRECSETTLRKRGRSKHVRSLFERTSRPPRLSRVSPRCVSHSAVQTGRNRTQFAEAASCCIAEDGYTDIVSLSVCGKLWPHGLTSLQLRVSPNARFYRTVLLMRASTLLPSQRGGHTTHVPQTAGQTTARPRSVARTREQRPASPRST